MSDAVSEVGHLLLVVTLFASLGGKGLRKWLGEEEGAIFAAAFGALLCLMPEAWDRFSQIRPVFGVIFILTVAMVSSFKPDLNRANWLWVVAWVIPFAFGTLAGFLPLEWNPTIYSRAFIGDLGAVSWIFLVHQLLRAVSSKTLLSACEGRALALPTVIGAAFIYPASLGVPGALDFYNADFRGLALPTAVAILAGFYLWQSFFVAAAGVGFGLFLYGLDLHESANLWDCLFDFPSVVVSAVILVKWARAFRRLRSGADAASLPPS